MEGEDIDHAIQDLRDDVEKIQELLRTVALILEEHTGKDIL